MIDGFPSEFDRIHDNIVLRRKEWREKHPRKKKSKKKKHNVQAEITHRSGMGEE